MRITPRDKYLYEPCSFVSTGCAYEDITGKTFDAELPDGLRDNGYLTLDNMNSFIRLFLPVKKKIFFPKGERLTLREYLLANQEKCIICVLGHFLYANRQDYWSYFDNDGDPVVCVWLLKGK
ncbi:MAG: hypothetical protein IKR18_08945 [Bacteroidaceae bacterium]|nr:hypothetical protein [Bacteroidaceae bacterium]